MYEFGNDKCDYCICYKSMCTKRPCKYSNCDSIEGCKNVLVQCGYIIDKKITTINELNKYWKMRINQIKKGE